MFSGVLASRAIYFGSGKLCEVCKELHLHNFAGSPHIFTTRERRATARRGMQFSGRPRASEAKSGAFTSPFKDDGATECRDSLLLLKARIYTTKMPLWARISIPVFHSMESEKIKQSIVEILPIKRENHDHFAFLPHISYLYK